MKQQEDGHAWSKKTWIVQNLTGVGTFKERKTIGPKGSNKMDIATKKRAREAARNIA